jgi:hypothetical protein
LGQFFVVINSLGDIVFKSPERFFGDFLAAKILSDKIFDEFGDVFISFGEIFVELVSDHLSELFSLLNGLSFFDGRVNFTGFATALGLGVVVVSR